MKATDCGCAEPGWCPRHECEKSEYWWSMCRRVPALIAAWDDGKGPPCDDGRKELRGPCVHRGDEVRHEVCPSCRGSVLVKVFRCDIYQECTIARKVGEIVDCQTCGDFLATNQGEVV